jgi:hypothetical protein
MLRSPVIWVYGCVWYVCEGGVSVRGSQVGVCDDAVNLWTERGGCTAVVETDAYPSSGMIGPPCEGCGYCCPHTTEFKATRRKPTPCQARDDVAIMTS